MQLNLHQIIAGVAAIAIAATAAAQSSTPHAAVRVVAHDSSGTAISAAELTVTSGLRDVVAHGITDDAGTALLSFDAKDSVDLQVTMRKIGYPRTDHFFAVGPRDTALVNIVVSRPTASTLATVKVTAKGDARWSSYHLDADDIAAADVTLFDGWDVVKRLRPVMLESRGGCPTGIKNVWVNGKRIVLPLPPTGIAAARARVGVPPGARFSYIPVSVLSDIAPEHIQELTYHDCFDSSMAAVGSTDALFIVLKPGIEYQRDVGSFVAEPTEKPTDKRK